MLHADLMEAAHDGAFEQTPDAFDTVRVHVSNHPLVHGVVDGLMRCVVVSDAPVGQKLIGIDRLSFVFHGALDEVAAALLSQLIADGVEMEIARDIVTVVAPTAREHGVDHATALAIVLGEVPTPGTAEWHRERFATSLREFWEAVLSALARLGEKWRR